MSWVEKAVSLFRAKPIEVSPDPQAVATDAVVAELRRVASELRDTNGALTRRVSTLKETDDRAQRS